jgi:hypothetical protein
VIDDIDPAVRADVRAALELAATTPIRGGALDGVTWTADEERAVPLHGGWSAEDLLPGPVRASLLIGRSDLLAAAARCRGSGRWAPLLVAANAWCYGPSPDGPGRTRRLLARPDLEARLATAVATLDTLGPIEAYHRLLNDGHVHGWGPALFTRFLDAADRRESEHALALDATLARAVNGLVPGSDLAVADWGTAEYAFHLGLLHRVAAEVGVAPTAVEAALTAKFAD